MEALVFIRNLEVEADASVPLFQGLRKPGKVGLSC